jgi:hypothetical protein
MDKRLILGPKPEVDPLKEVSDSLLSAATDAEVKWRDRSAPRGREHFYIGAVLGLAVTFFFPLLSLMALLLSLCFAVVLQILRPNSLVDVWSPLSIIELDAAEDGENVASNKNGKSTTVVGMELSDASSVLLGDLGSLLRSLPMSHGFTLSVQLGPVSLDSVLRYEGLTDRLDAYLGRMDEGSRESYVAGRGGFWRGHAIMIGHLSDSSETSEFESSVFGGVPEPKWHRISPSDLRRRVSTNSLSRYCDGFFANGRELSEWLVQVASELAPEVGSNVPGEFISPVRAIPHDYPLGRSMNPETLQVGPHNGLSHGDLENGTIICGGSRSARRHTLALLIQRLLSSGRGVTVISSSDDAPRLASLDGNAVLLTLGKDLVLNPVDPDNVPRSRYIPQLMTALEVLAATDLRGAASLELALNSALSSGDSTIADVRIPTAAQESIDNSGSELSASSAPSPKAMAGFEAVRSLHQGSGAKAFYGAQSLPMSRLTDCRLAVVQARLGTVFLTTFALDLLCIKLSGLQHDSNHVIILDEPDNMRIRNRRYTRRDSWSETMLRGLKKRGPIVITLEHPVDMAPGAIGVLESSIALRMREGPDISTAVDILGLSVVGTGMHTKARHSARETSFLRVMEDNMALLRRGELQTCMPIQLPPLENPLKEIGRDTLEERLKRIVSGDTPEMKPGASLLSHIVGVNVDTAERVLRLLERYEPLTEQAIRKYMQTNRETDDENVEGVLTQLERAHLILRGHEVHSNVSYANYRITMKGSMALRQREREGDS